MVDTLTTASVAASQAYAPYQKEGTPRTVGQTTKETHSEIYNHRIEKLIIQTNLSMTETALEVFWQALEEESEGESPQAVSATQQEFYAQQLGNNAATHRPLGTTLDILV